jgi:hypothetical protein
VKEIAKHAVGLMENALKFSDEVPKGPWRNFALKVAHRLKGWIAALAALALAQASLLFERMIHRAKISWEYASE